MLLLILCISIRSLASKKLEEKSFPSSQRKQLTNLLSKLDVEISKQGISDIPLKELSKQRGKDVVTKCFHKMGIVVPYDRNTELGYRPLPLTDSKSTAVCPLCQQKPIMLCWVIKELGADFKVFTHFKTPKGLRL